MATFIERLKGLRGGLNQAEFARKLGLPPNSYNRYESGARVPDIDVLSHMAQRLGVSTDYLLGLDSQSGTRPSASDIPAVDRQAQALANQSETLVNQSKTLVNQSESLTVLARSLEIAIRKGTKTAKNRGAV